MAEQTAVSSSRETRFLGIFDRRYRDVIGVIAIETGAGLVAFG
ncbi:hypothetical protein [Coleofasciculus chthonoplastes]|nr:hypothetical protein [Coleofasciculus chthonoplastes]